GHQLSRHGVQRANSDQASFRVRSDNPRALPADVQRKHYVAEYRRPAADATATAQGRQRAAAAPVVIVFRGPSPFLSLELEAGAGLVSSLMLRTMTRPEWLLAVTNDFDAFLVDHAACERKASATALTFVAHYPDRAELVSAMIQLAREELDHF